jgi:16S rRNA (uracil1498-N3)-methyltransferase
MNCRIFIDELPAQNAGTTLTLSSDEGRYLSRVLRLAEGDSVTICTDGGLEYECSIKEIKGKSVIVSIDSLCKVERESPLDITLCQALPKGKKMDLILQKGTELGVRRFVPFISSRSVSRPAGETEKSSRWSKIVLEAARQCGRNFIPPVEKTADFDEMLSGFAGLNDDSVLKIIPWEGEEVQGIKSLAGACVREAVLLIGPEGGFSEEEAVRAGQAGFKPVTLGRRLLRTETAGLATVSILQYLWGDMD